MFECFDIAVIERARGILAGVEFGNDAVGLEFFDKGVDFIEGDFVVGDSAPWSVPAIEDEHSDFAVVGEEFGELIFDELDFGGGDVVVADVVAKIKNGVVEAGFDVEVTAGFDKLCNDIDAGVIDRGFGGPDREAVMVLCG